MDVLLKRLVKVHHKIVNNKKEERELTLLIRKQEGEATDSFFNEFIEVFGGIDGEASNNANGAVPRVKGRLLAISPYNSIINKRYFVEVEGKIKRFWYFFIDEV